MFRLFLLFVCLYTECNCACRQSFMTFCDSLDDLQNDDVENWTELVVGSEISDPSELQSIDYDSVGLDKLEKLTTLIIVGQVKDIKSNTFEPDTDFTRLEYLQLYGNDIGRIRFSTFAAMTLRKLSLVNNNIEYIHKGMFYNCEIASIDLSQNKLEMIETGVFGEEFLSNATKEIILRRNKLEFIQDHSFPSSLEVLNLDFNNMKTLHYGVFDNLCHLRELTISNNRLASIPNFLKLQDIRVINLSHNDIVGFNARDFNNLTQLEVLDLGHNKISRANIFEDFCYPKRHPSLQISLVFNELTHLVIGSDSFKDHIVSLYGNPWNCKCWQIVEKFMVDNQVKRNKCDFKFFGNGNVPYCIDYSETDCSKSYYKNPNISEKDLEKFINILKGSLKTVKCSLSPKRL